MSYSTSMEVNIGTSHQALPICLALTCESSINGGHSGS